MIPMSDTRKPAADTPAPIPDRRNPERKDRRESGRGGRRATDTFKRLADFAYKLLTEPPR